MITITLKDGSIKKVNKNNSIQQIAESIGDGLARSALAGEVDGVLRDLSYRLEQDCTLIILTFHDEGGKKVYRHTVSHIMAQAVKKLFPR